MIDLDAAACRGCDPEVFHPTPHDATGVAAARAVCAGCPIRLDCLALALATPSTRGIWGGLTERERRADQTPRPPARKFSVTHA